MATKKTPSNKSLKQLADSLPPAYELHRSGGEKVGKLSEELQEKYKDVKEKRHEAIMADPLFPKGCIILSDHVTIWKPNIYKAQINHYRRLRNAYSLKGEKGVTDYLAEIRKAQLERKAKLEKEKQVDPTGDKPFGNEEKQPDTVVASSHGLFGDKEILNKEVTNNDTLGDG